MQLFFKIFFGAVIRGTKSQRWARGQLKYYAALVLCGPEQPKKMAQFSPDFYAIFKKKINNKGLQGEMAQLSPDFHVISNKKNLRSSQTDLSVSFRWPL